MPLSDLAAPFVRHRALLGALSRRELANRYRTSFLGNLWMLITPLLMLAMYTLRLMMAWTSLTPQEPVGKLLHVLVDLRDQSAKFVHAHQ